MTTKPHQARKRFGQNFLQDYSVIARLNDAIAAKSDDNIVEIGPGQGALTEPLLKSVSKLNVIELDRDLIPILEQKFQDKDLTIFSSDALKFDFTQLFNDKPLRVVGNLPYNISTPLLFHLLQYQQNIQDMHFMLQLEVVDRLSAKPSSKSYGRISVICQYYCAVDKLFLVPPEAFDPVPKVMSAIVLLKPRIYPIAVKDEILFRRVVKCSFAQRRKTLRNNLKQLLNAEQLDTLSINLGLRPEQLSVDDYVNLSNEVSCFDLEPNNNN